MVASGPALTKSSTIFKAFRLNFRFQTKFQLKNDFKFTITKISGYYRNVQQISLKFQISKDILGPLNGWLMG